MINIPFHWPYIPIQPEKFPVHLKLMLNSRYYWLFELFNKMKIKTRIKQVD